jgi:hypothetical protein
MIAKGAAGIDLFELVPGSKDWYEMIGERDAVKQASGS